MTVRASDAPRHGRRPHADKDKRRLARCLYRLHKRLHLGTKHLPWLTASDSGRIARVAIGVLLVIGGLLGFLPILGFWMLPLGLVVLAQDVPWLGRPIGRLFIVAERRWRKWRRRRR
jgi:hypothetical protein